MQQSFKKLFFSFLIHISTLKPSTKVDLFRAEASFNYHNVHEWGNKFPECNGNMQSPINIDPSKIFVINESSRLQFIGYNELPKNMTLKTNGHTVKLDVKWNGSPPFLTFGRLKSQYVFDSLHFHWGKNSKKGSEHKFMNVSFPLEMHMVHFRSIFDNAKEAARHKHSFVVIGMVFEISNTGDSIFSPLAASLSSIEGPHDSKQVEPFRLSAFNLRPRTGYIIYSGSLTTPPCSETVTWLLSTHVLSITNPELKLFRINNKLAYGDKSNYRPIQSLNRRKIFYYPRY